MTIYYTSNDASAGFDATTAGNQATSFANIIGTWLVGTTLPTSGHTHTYGSTSKADGDIALATGVTAVADMEVLYAQKLATGWVQGTTHPTIGPVLRSNSAGTAHYAVVVSHSGSALVGYIFVKNGGGYSVAVGPTTISKTFAVGDVMWLRAHRGPENVALSHLTALAVFAISDANPSMIHLTVPRAARLRRAALPGVAIHRGNLAPDDVVIHEGLPVTSVARTVRDLLAAGGRIDLIRQAIADARREGFIGGAETRRLRRLVNKHLMALEAGAQPPPA